MDILGVDSYAFLQKIIYKSILAEEEKANCLEIENGKDLALYLCNHLNRAE